jgi:hypothetical protein
MMPVSEKPTSGGTEMAKIIMYGNPSIQVTRTEDEYGEVIMKITTEGGSPGEAIEFHCGAGQVDADCLRGELESAHEAADDIFSDWEDLPDETDGSVTEDRGGYIVTLEGRNPEGMPRGGYPSRDIATYELARLMADSGYFPNTWYFNERGNYDMTNEEVRAFHDERGDKLLSLPDAEYEEGTRVWLDQEGYPYVVDHDYGAMGIVIHVSGDPSITEFLSGDERTRLLPVDESFAEDNEN